MMFLISKLVAVWTSLLEALLLLLTNLHKSTTIETSIFVVLVLRFIPIDRPAELPWNLDLAKSPVELLFSNEQLTMLML